MLYFLHFGIFNHFTKKYDSFIEVDIFQQNPKMEDILKTKKVIGPSSCSVIYYDCQRDSVNKVQLFNAVEKFDILGLYSTSVYHFNIEIPKSKS